MSKVVNFGFFNADRFLQQVRLAKSLYDKDDDGARSLMGIQGLCWYCAVVGASLWGIGELATWSFCFVGATVVCAFCQDHDEDVCSFCPSWLPSTLYNLPY